MPDRDLPTALDLPMVDPLPEPTQKYFDICTEKLGRFDAMFLIIGFQAGHKQKAPP